MPIAASGSAIRSAEEWEMSRSCQSGMPSITGTNCARTIRASPQIRSRHDRVLLVRHRARSPSGPCRTARPARAPRCAGRAGPPARWPRRPWPGRPAPRPTRRCRRAARPASPRRPARGRARGATWRLDRRVDVGVGADRAGDLRTPRRPRGRARSRSRRAGHAEGEVGDPVAPDVRLGVDAVGAPDPQRRPVLQRVVAQRGDQRVRLGQQQVGRLGELQRERGVEQVRGRHAEVHVGGGLARRRCCRPTRSGTR